MHKLDRGSVPVPECLAKAEPGWGYDKLKKPEKAQIRSALLEIQKQRCAYCERRTGTAENEGHVEHFRKQAENKHLDLTWSNLFWSCNDEKTCGKHKDKCDRKVSGVPQAVFDVNDLIDPCVHDPEHYLQFLPDGTVRPRDDLDELNRRCAAETIRVFQLADSPYLRKSREDAVKPYIRIVTILLKGNAAMLIEYIESVRTELDDAPFCTVIRQYLRGLVK